MKRDPFTEDIIGCMIEVHRTLGPGLLESTYQRCLGQELTLNHIRFKLEHSLPVEYKGMQIDCGYRIDLLIEDRLIVELKAVDTVKDIHRAQIMTYMKLSGIDIGLLVNFNVSKLIDGIQRFRM
ncbi:GxxExxY protein [Planctomycetota bacterium]